MTDVSEKIARVPALVRPTIRATRRAVRETAGGANEVVYRGGPPRSSRTMWKLLRYVVDGVPVIGIGTYPTYATLFFYQGRELDDHSGLLQGSGKNMRFVRLRAPRDASRRAVRRLLRRAFSSARKPAAPRS